MKSRMKHATLWWPLTLLVCLSLMVSLVWAQAREVVSGHIIDWPTIETGPLSGLSDHHRAFLKQEFPFFVEYIEDLMEEDSEEARFRLREYREVLAEYLPELMEMQEHHPEAYGLEKRMLALDFRSERLGERIQESQPGQERDQMMDKLKRTLEEVFDLKQGRRRMEAEQIERELREIRELIQKRGDNKAMIINRRFEDLTGRPDLYEW